MKKRIIVVILSVLVLSALVPCGCTDKRPGQADTLPSDSVGADTLARDSAEMVMDETPMPKAADELFDDFVFNFASNRKVQQKRIAFPLPVYRHNVLEKKIGKGEWKTEHFFMRQEYYTLIFDNPKDKRLVKDTTVEHVAVEKIIFDRKLIQSFSFDRINGEWMLTAVRYDAIDANRNAGFLNFYLRFSTDSAFQVESLAEEVQFTAPDPDDDFASITGVIVPQQWHDFKPGLIPEGTIYNIVYGQKHSESNRKLFVIRGIANGLEMEMNFKRIDGKWKLTQFTS